MPHEESVGIVLYKDREFLLLKYRAGHWGFAKGKSETGEELIETARRETKEETGIEGVYIAKGFLEKEEYFFKRHGKTIHKEVHYFLGEAPTKEVKLSEEHVGYKWLTFQEAMSQVTFRETKNVLKLAHDFLEEHGEG